MIMIKEVVSKRDLKQFIDFPVKLFKGVEQFSPAIFEDEMDNLTPGKNPAFTWCDFKLFLAYKNEKIVGRICGIISHFANNKYQQKRVRFNRIDMIDDIEVTRALIAAVESWGKEKEMTEIVGPLGYSDQDKEGLLVEGYEFGNMFATFYHFPYYKVHLETLGFMPDAKWVEHRIDIPKSLDERYDRLRDYICDKYDVKIKTFKNKRQLQPYIVQVLSLVNKAYDHLYGYVPISEDFMQSLAKQFIPLLNLRYFNLVVDQNDKVVAFGISVPSPVFALKKINGKLYPFGFIRFLRALKKSKQLDLLLVAIEPELKNSGIINLVLGEAIKHAIEDGIEYAETGPQLEDNISVQSLWKKFEFINHKKRVCFVKKIGSN
ncbi:MAG: hypothetical protein AB7E23_00315 [Bacilli bacterium]